MEFYLEFNGDGARLLKRCIDLYLERWPGGDPGEQEHLMALQTTFAAMVLEDTMNNS